MRQKAERWTGPFYIFIQPDGYSLHFTDIRVAGRVAGIPTRNVAEHCASVFSGRDPIAKNKSIQSKHTILKTKSKWFVGLVDLRAHPTYQNVPWSLYNTFLRTFITIQTPLLAIFEALPTLELPELLSQALFFSPLHIFVIQKLEPNKTWAKNGPLFFNACCVVMAQYRTAAPILIEEDVGPGTHETSR